MVKYKEDLDKIKHEKYDMSQSQLQNPESPSKCTSWLIKQIQNLTDITPC